jgi:ABC-2 type transport system permease protein
MNIREQYIALKTLVIKEILRFSRIWLQTILPPVITTALYFIIFGNLIGPRIGDMGGVSYMDYIVPGLILMAVITNSYANVVSSFFGTKFHRNIEELMVAPVPAHIVVLGFVMGGMARGVAVGMAVTAVSLLFSGIHLYNLGIIISMTLLTSMLFSLAGFINGIFARSFDDISIIPTFVLTPLTYLGGIFYSISLLPEFWQHASMLNPILYMVNAFRFGFLGITDISITASYMIIMSFVITLFIASVYLLRRGVGIRS